MNKADFDFSTAIYGDIYLDLIMENSNKLLGQRSQSCRDLDTATT